MMALTNATSGDSVAGRSSSRLTIAAPPWRSGASSSSSFVGTCRKKVRGETPAAEAISSVVTAS